MFYTTNEYTLSKFLKKKERKLILVTYQSFEKFTNICIEENRDIDIIIYDESHHIVGSNIQKVIFENDELESIIDKSIFFTATPVNSNGIQMYDKENPDENDCGPFTI